MPDCTPRCTCFTAGPTSIMEDAVARRSRMTILKRQREVKKAEKRAIKRAKKQGMVVEGSAEPRPTIDVAALFGRPAENKENSN